MRRLFLLFILGQSTVYSQLKRSDIADSSKAGIKTTNTNWQTFRSFGGQLGYCRLQCNQFDIGINYYWSKMKHDVNQEKEDVYHTFGPSLACIVLEKNNTNIIGTQIGINYHYYYSICPRVNVAFEDYLNHDQRLGVDLGFSVLGLYTYIGYHQPIGTLETSGISKFRFGLKYIFNRALLKAAEKNWH